MSRDLEALRERDKREAWKIFVAGYGTFDFEGTEAEAEAMRTHKVQWEHGAGWKWRASLERPSDALTARICAAWERREGVPRVWLRRRRSALQKEASNA